MKDIYKEHELHNEYESNCSTCFSENLMIKTSFNKQNKLHKLREELGITKNHFTDSQINPNPIRD